MGYTIVTLVLLIGFVVYINYRIRRGEDQRYQNLSAFLEEERESSFIRKQHIDDAYFIPADVSALPIRSYDQNDEAHAYLASLQSSVLSAAARKMLRFPDEMTNRDIKMKYGTANLDVVAGYEDNLSHFFQCLQNWGAGLYEHGFKDDAVKVLAYALSLGSDLSGTVELLFTAYMEAPDHDNLRKLRDRAAAMPYLVGKDQLLAKMDEALRKTH